MLEPGDVVIQQGENTNHLFTVLDGVLIRYRHLEDDRRQIVNFMFPGDLIGLQGAFDEPATHSVAALRQARLCRFDRSTFYDIVSNQPRLSYDMIWVAAKEETALEEHIVSLGQRSAKERVTHLAVWLVDRAAATGMAMDRNRIKLPIKQAQIADMLGLSLVHTNRTIKALEREKLVEWTPGQIHVPDMEAACEYAQYKRTENQARPYI